MLSLGISPRDEPSSTDLSTWVLVGEEPGSSEIFGDVGEPTSSGILGGCKG